MDSLKTKLGMTSNVQNMWHGTRTTPSNAITDSDEGFDLRFCRDGMQGIGNYFAEQAAYSASPNFVTKESDGTKGLFFARV